MTERTLSLGKGKNGSTKIVTGWINSHWHTKASWPVVENCHQVLNLELDGHCLMDVDRLRRVRRKGTGEECKPLGQAGCR